MTLDGKLLHRAQLRLDARRTENAQRLARRTRQVYERLPRVRELDDKLQQTAALGIARALQSGQDPQAAIARLRDQNLAIQAERQRILEAGGYPRDWLEEHFDCPRCQDRGYVMGEPCDCLLALYKEEQAKELSAQLKLGEESFDSFRLDYYGEQERPRMELIYETCLEYARKFGPAAPNLFLTGGTGLGKTYLATCIAKVVSEKGFSVLYETAVSLLAKFEAEKFGRAEGSEVRRLQDCDLLILDDLGTELSGAFTNSAIYTLINGRLTGAKKTVICTNLSGEELQRRYSPQILSRLEGEYLQLHFVGKDIRLLKKQRGLS